VAWASVDDIKERLATIKGQITVGDDETYTFTTTAVQNAINTAHQILLTEYGITSDVESGIDSTKAVGAILKEMEILMTCIDLLSRSPQDDITADGVKQLENRLENIRFKLATLLDLSIYTESMTDPTYSQFKIDEDIIYDQD